MKEKRPKLRLRRPFLIALPLLLIVSIVSLTFIVINNRSYSAAVEKTVQTEPKVENKVTKETSILRDNALINAYKEFVNDRQQENTVRFYADKFKLKEDKIVEIAKKLTGDFKNESYLKTNVIGNAKVIKKLGKFKNFEAGVAYFVRDIYRNPERYGTTRNAIIASNYVEPVTNIKNGKIIMKNGLTFEQFYGRVADMFEVDKTIALAMVYHESGNMKSGLARNKNNIGGLKGGSGWMSFPTLEAGVIAHVLTIKSISEKNGFDIKDPDGIYKFSGIYVRGNVNSPSEDWVNKVNIFKEKIEKKDVFTIK